MKNHRSLRLLALLAAFTTGVLSLSAQTLVGTDDFNDNNLGTIGAGNRWRFDAALAGSGTAFVNQNGRLEFTASTTSGHNARALGWISPASSGNAYTLDWMATVSVTNQSVISSGFTYAGLEAYTTYDPDGAGGVAPTSNAYYGIYLSVNAGTGNRLVTEWGVWNSGTSDYDRNTASVAIADMTDVLLRLEWDAGAQNLAAQYSTDGVNFVTGQTFSLSGAHTGLGAPASNGFGLEISGVANNTGLAIGSGAITYDNMAVSAVPEPSTYAILAGLGALGLVFWQRRRMQAGSKA